MKMQRSYKKKTRRKVLRFGMNVLTISFKQRLTNPHTYRHSGRAVRIQNCEQQTKNRKIIWNSNNNRLNGNIFCSLLFESQRTSIFDICLWARIELLQSKHIDMNIWLHFISFCTPKCSWKLRIKSYRGWPSLICFGLLSMPVELRMFRM